MSYFTREAWGARPARARSAMNPASVTHTFVHYTAGPVTQTPRQIQNFHMDTRGWNDIAYSFLVDQQGNVYEGRGWFVIGGHTKGMNSKSHAICWIGGPNDTPTEAALASINQLIAECHERLGRTTTVLGHYEAPGAATSCPGGPLKTWLRAGRPVGSATPAPAPAPQPAPVKVPATVKLGSKNTAVVKQLQERLNLHAKNLGARKLAVDGDFGPKTDKLTRSFQKAVGLAADGIVGPKTWAKLLETPR